ncbi:hypothetical protein ACFE04_013832 [Oxalis oulophora]
MALEAVVYQQQDQYCYGCTKEFYYGTASCFDFQEDNKSLLAIRDNNTNVEEVEGMHEDSSVATKTMTTTTERRKRRRGKSGKNEKEMENQRKRMTHIQVERNRRKLMNEYLAVLRTLMPPSYVQRGDQASIIGGAINFVKELEQVLTFTEAHQRTTQLQQKQDKKCFDSPAFAKFFDFPQFSKYTNHSLPSSSMEDDRPMLAESAAADIEVTMVERHANLKILVKKQHRQLLKLIDGLQGLRINILHLNVTSFDQLVLYSASVKIEEGCHLNTVDDIAAAINQLIGRIQEESQRGHEFELVY